MLQNRKLKYFRGLPFHSRTLQNSPFLSYTDI